MKQFAKAGLAALALMICAGLATTSAQAHGMRHYPAHGQLAGGVVVQSRTTIVIQHEVQAVQLMHYAYRGHRYAFGAGPLWSHHLHYCTHRFRSYNPHTNLFLAYSGGYHHCRSPYIQ
ncbi:MAG: BA14K family protein [Rhizobiales bacterium]|nr:BA14K family protein [Hyphomicrobiales bacterium]MBO6697694.1 BA14K family protein [Hyphomicrobiales bacterium]MBO6736051.1 BA14K family protein [Hyphomicrobiales bacterium]MBO6912521.1 BA14K family protein [Hyphomicrobiales bacterium]MBO6956362.1 BA14K family protein [Hyphomicrobiales bacterium]